MGNLMSEGNGNNMWYHSIVVDNLELNSNIDILGKGSVTS